MSENESKEKGIPCIPVSSNIAVRASSGSCTASFIIGFATQSTLSNLASGLLVMVSRPFDVGDKVNIAGVSGTVESVTSISTVIRDAEGRVTIVPNKKVWDSVIINEGRPDPA